MKILFIGLGSIAKKHITALQEIGRFEIFALRSSHHAVSEPGVKDIFEEGEVVGGDFDFFIISNPTFNHATTIKSLLPFNKPLFIEKPIFDRVSAENDQLIQEIKTQNIPNYVACNLRFLEVLNQIKPLIKGKRINEVNIYCGSYLPDWRPGRNFRENYSANKEMGGGVHIDLIHELDYLYWIFGEPERVYSVFKNNSSLEISAVDYANYVWEYKDFAASVILNYYRPDAKRTLEIITAKDSFLIDLLKNKIYKNGEVVFSSNQQFLNTYKLQMEFFLNKVLIEKKSHFNTAEEAYKILKLCLKE